MDVALPMLAGRSDEEIARAASHAIVWNTLLPKNAIHVYVDNGRITLEGNVDWQYQRKAAAKCVRDLARVRDVNNHIVAQPHADQVAVQTQIEAAFLRNARVGARGIHVDIRANRVILSGTVRSWLERKAAERAAWGAGRRQRREPPHRYPSAGLRR